MAMFSTRYTNSGERKLENLTYYDEESDSYKTGTFYMPDIAFTVIRSIP